jgi:NADH-quinone oxidoreductase subunit L
MNSTWIVLTILLPPLIGFLINGFSFKNQNYLRAGILGSFAAGLSFLGTLLAWKSLLSLPSGQESLTVSLFNWIQVGELNVGFDFVIDQISIIMLLIVTGVGTLIHIFSVGYMSHDARPAKFFAYLNFFLFNMLLLVMGKNLLVMFVGWEGVGLCSYLLIGFWFTDKEKAAAGMKAFVTNRIGDAGFLLGMFMLFITFGTLDFNELIQLIPSIPEAGWLGPITLACLFLFVGATGKSAQIPLYVWLPDAMAGPTPVSALIHAATMVTAGVYMIIRLSPLYLLAPNVMMLIAIIGGLTAFFAALIGLTQWDIKKILAYSTVSQLGYMFLAVGTGAFIPALFHLMTHAFFKALMFLGSGSVIHAMHEEQDIRKMGGLKKYLPITHWTFVAGWLAIIGVPPLAGFFSKDEILWFSYSSPQGHPLLWILGVVTAGITAFYMTRLMCLTFWGESRVSKDVHPHESPMSMTFPLIVLGILSVVGGWVGIPHVLGHPLHIPNFLEAWLNKWGLKNPQVEHASVVLEFSLMGISFGFASLMAWISYNFYIVKPGRAELFTNRFQKTYRFVYNKYFVDEFYFEKIINPLIEVSKGLWVYIDVNFIDKMTYKMSDFVKSSSEGFKSLQNGNMQQYAMYIALGVVASVTYILMG